MTSGHPTVRDVLLTNFVWEKGRVIAGRHPGEIRMDDLGNPIARSQYGTQGPMGWEIDHILPVALGGTDDLSNLRPLHWRANRSSGGRLADILK